MRDLSLDEVLGMAGLASVPCLRRQGLCPGDGCAPVGAFRGLPLWRLSDAVAVVVPAGRAARMEANRLCAVCGARSDDPWPLGPDRRMRYCPEHMAESWVRSWAVDHHIAMAKSIEWATGILLDSSAVAVVFDAQLGQPGRFVVMDFQGHVLVDEGVALSRVSERPLGFGYVLAADSGADPDELVGALVGRTLVSPAWWQVGRFLSFVPTSGRLFAAGVPRIHRVDEWVGRWNGLQPHDGVDGVRFADAVKPHTFGGSPLQQAMDVVSWVCSIRAGLIDDSFDALER